MMASPPTEPKLPPTLVQADRRSPVGGRASGAPGRSDSLTPGPDAGTAPRPSLIPGDDPRIGAAAAGDRDAASSLLAVLLPRARNLVRYLAPGDSDVDDLAQAALLEVLRALPSFEGRSALTTWADRITVRETLRRVKRKRLRLARRRQLEEQQALVPEMGPGVDERYQARRRVAAMLDQLPGAQRNVLVLHHVVGLSVPEVADALDIPFDTAKSRLRLAVARLRTLYGEADE